MNNYLKRPMVFFAIAITLSFIFGLYDPILFHFLIALFTIFIGFLMFVLAINSRVYTEKTVLLVLAASYMYISCLDLLHLITFIGVGSMGTSLNNSYQFFATARIFEASIFVISFAFKKHPEHINYRYSQVIGFAVLITTSIIILFNLTTPYYIEGVGQTSLAIAFSYLTAFVLLLSIFFVYRKEMDINQKRLLIVMLLMKIIAQVLHANFVEVGDLLETTSLSLRFASYAILYMIFIQQIVNNPYESVYSLFESKEKELLHLSQRDSLTGLYNHSLTFQKIEEAISNIGKGYDDLCVVLFDVDNFKQINDTYGHIKGDEMLTEVTNIISSLGMKDQVVGRYGGDEFVLAIPDLKEEKVKALFSRINMEINELAKSTGIKITFSAGVVLWRMGDNATDLIRKADIKMYQSKEKGKNQYMIWKDSLGK